MALWEGQCDAVKFFNQFFKTNGITPSLFILSTSVYNIHKYYENVPHSDNNILMLVQT